MNNQTVMRELIDCCSDLQKIKKEMNRNKLSPANRFLTDYAIIRASGTIEISLKQIITHFCCNSNVPQANQYILSTHEKMSYSIKYNDLLSRLKKFDSHWKTSLKKLVDQDNKRNMHIDRWNSLINERHQIAHGNVTNTTITINNTISYFRSAIKIIRYIDSVIK